MPSGNKSKIYISGMNSGQNPCSGLGIARCIRKAFPELTLVGVDHTPASSGLHDAVIDEVKVFPLWNQIDDRLHAQTVRELLTGRTLWIPSIDVDVHWLAENVGAHSSILAPSLTMLERTAKPAVKAFRALGFGIADFIPASLPPSEIHAFCRAHSWQCWLKSPFHEAKRIVNWGQFERAREQMSEAWKTSALFLQRNIVGNEESIAFAAYQGKLLGAIHLEKYQATAEGKTWAGRAVSLDGELFEVMKEVIAEIGWSGGGEIEFMRDCDGKKWIIECNPRFPAWIYGGALAGVNLPARLVGHCWSLPVLEARSAYPVFTRVVQEIPAKSSVGIPVPRIAESAVWTADGKMGKGGPAVSALLPNLRKSQDKSSDETAAPESAPPSDALIHEITELTHAFTGETPTRLFLETKARERFSALAHRMEQARRQTPAIRIGYSVKTSPTEQHLRLARSSGFLAECISQLEIKRALAAGFSADQIILNGPGKFWPTSAKPVTGMHLLFCDSFEEFGRVVRIPDIAACLGYRLRLPGLASRFGSSLDEFEQFSKMARSLEALKAMKPRPRLGFHFHMPSWSIGVKRWMEALHSLLLWCKAMEDSGAISVSCLDLGGGFFPEDLESLDFESIQESVHSILPHARELYFEPGRALTQDTEVLVSRVLDVRWSREEAPEKMPEKMPEKINERVQEVVVDACIAELPMAQGFPHPVFYRPKQGAYSEGSCSFLKKGKARVLGRICMEDDILAKNIELPISTRIGDLVIFGNAGAYERSMSYGFGRG